MHHNQSASSPIDKSFLATALAQNHSMEPKSFVVQVNVLDTHPCATWAEAMTLAAEYRRAGHQVDILDSAGFLHVTWEDFDSEM